MQAIDIKEGVGLVVALKANYIVVDLDINSVKSLKERDLSSYVMDNILYKVSFPAEFHAQTAAEAALKLNMQLSDKLEEIDKIIIETQEPGMRIISKEGPLTNYADRDHCIEYIVVWCLLKVSRLEFNK